MRFYLVFFFSSTRHLQHNIIRPFLNGDPFLYETKPTVWHVHCVFTRSTMFNGRYDKNRRSTYAYSYRILNTRRAYEHDIPARGHAENCSPTWRSRRCRQARRAPPPSLEQTIVKRPRAVPLSPVVAAPPVFQIYTPYTAGIFGIVGNYRRYRGFTRLVECFV